jgi:hypothetical protein
MANATKNTGKKPPTSKAPKANGQANNWTFPKPESGTSVLTPEQKAALQAKAKPAATSAPAAPQPPASIATPRDAQNSEHFVGQLGTENLWGFKLVNPKDTSKGMIVTHYQGYDIVSQHQRTSSFADKLYHDMLEKCLVYIDGVVHRLVDETE